MKILVIGGGIAGLTAARRLNATVITQTNEFTFTPLLPDVINGKRTDAVRPIKHNKLIIGEVTKIDPTNNQIYISGMPYEYDYLVLATGAKAATPIAGIKTYAETFYTIQDALKIKEWIAKHPSTQKKRNEIIIIGGGPTGVEIAFELQKHANITILHGADRILPTFSPACQTYTERALTKKGITYHCNELVKRISVREVATQRSYPYDLCIWTAGVQANLLDDAPKQHGFLVNQFLQLQGYENVFACGDCAQSGSPLTAQAAIAEAHAVSANIQRHRSNRALKKFVFKDKGQMIALGANAHIQTKWFSLKGTLAAWIRKKYYAFTLRNF